jgi:transmembrane sensor
VEANHAEDIPIDEQAAYWLRVMQNPSADDRAAFWAWIEASREHVRELLLIAKIDQELEGFDRARRIDIQALLSQGSAHRAVNRRSRTRRMVGIAASMLIAAAIGFWAYFTLTQQTTYATRAGEQQLVRLDDGSTVFLNTRSTMQVRYTGQARDLYLDTGQALFRVTRDAARPFRVHTKTAMIQAIGTQFDVRVFENRTAVAVVEGAVQVLPSKQDASVGHHAVSKKPQRITAGAGATIDAGGKIGKTRIIDATATIAWTQQRLVFKGETLGEIVAEFNRYNVLPKLRIEGEELRGRRFIATFTAHDPTALIDYLKQDPSIVFEREGDEIAILESNSNIDRAGRRQGRSRAP